MVIKSYKNVGKCKEMQGLCKLLQVKQLVDPNGEIMSILQMSRVWAQGKIEPHEKLVLLAIADHSDDNGTAWPSIPTIAAKSGLSVRTVQRIIKKSVEQGILKISPRESSTGRTTSNKYQLFPNDQEGCHHDTGRVSQCHRGGRHGVTLISLNHHTEPSNEIGQLPASSLKAISSFHLFWTAYPKKTGKAAALKIWQRLNPSPETITAILTSIEWQRRQHDWMKDDGRFIPHPSTWLNGRRWEDEPPVTASTPARRLQVVL